MAGGSYVKQPNGRWRARVMIAGRTYSVTRRTKQAARLAVADLELEHADDAPVRRPSSETVEAVVGEWWPRHSRRLADSTRIDYRRVIDKFILPNLGDIRIGDLHQTDLNRLYDTMLADGIGPARIRRVHGVMSVICGHAVKADLIPTSPVAKADPPRVIEKPIDPPDAEQIRQLLEHAHKIRPGFAAFLRLAAVTGARRGELIALRIDDLAADTLIIARSVSVAAGDHGVGTSLVEKETKTRNIRRITIDTDTVTILAAQIAVLTERADACKTQLVDGHFLFSDAMDAGMPWRPDAVSRDFARCCKASKLTGIRLHDLRHAAATAMMAAGVDVVTGASRLGHSRRDTFLNRYSHAMPATDGHAAQVIADGLR